MKNSSWNKTTRESGVAIVEAVLITALIAVVSIVSVQEFSNALTGPGVACKEDDSTCNEETVAYEFWVKKPGLLHIASNAIERGAESGAADVVIPAR